MVWLVSEWTHCHRFRIVVIAISVALILLDYSMNWLDRAREHISSETLHSLFGKCQFYRLSIVKWTSADQFCDCAYCLFGRLFSIDTFGSVRRIRYHCDRKHARLKPLLGFTLVFLRRNSFDFGLNVVICCGDAGNWIESYDKHLKRLSF